LLNCEARLVRSCCQPAARQESDLPSNQADELIYPAWSVQCSRFRPSPRFIHRIRKATRSLISEVLVDYRPPDCMVCSSVASEKW